MKVLLDECVPSAMAEVILGHQVTHCAQAGLAGISNGELLRRAVELGFEGFVTLDKGIPHQQPIARMPLRFVVVRAGDDDLDVLLSYAGRIGAALDETGLGQVAVLTPLT